MSDHYLAPELRMGVNVNAPSLDAARVLGDGIRHAENLARAQAEDVAAARAAADAIKSIPEIDLTPAVCAQIVAVLSARVTNASWSHHLNAHEAIGYLDDAVDTLDAV